MRTSRTTNLAVFLVALSLLTFVAPAANAGTPEPADHRDGTLTLGQLAPQTGQFSNVVQSFTTPVALAVDEINAAGGVLGQPVGYTVADDGTQQEVALASLETMLDGGKIDAVIGPSTSGTALGILDAVRRAKVLDCSGSNMSLELSTAKSGGFYFRTVPPDSVQGTALADLVLGDQHERVAILARRDTYGVGLSRPMKAALTKGGAKVVADVTFDTDAASVDADVGKVARAKPDAVVVLGFDADGAVVVRTLIAQGLGPQQVAVYASDGMRTDSFGQLVDQSNPGVVAGIKGASVAVAPAGVQSPFNERFAATGVEPIFSAYYYDCTILTALAAEKAKSDNPDDMKRAFAANTRGRVRCNTYADCKEALDDKKTIQYQGASAVFKDMNDFGAFEPRAGAYEVWAFDANGRDVVGPPDTQIRVR